MFEIWQWPIDLVIFSVGWSRPHTSFDIKNVWGWWGRKLETMSTTARNLKEEDLSSTLMMLFSDMYVLCCCLSLVAGCGKSLLDEVGEGHLVAWEEALDSRSLSLAECVLLWVRQLSPLVNGGCLVALRKGVVSLNELLESSLHF